MPNNTTELTGKIGLALGGGSARGWAHIGVIRALAETGITVHCVAGTSIGSIVGAAFALGKIDALEELARRIDWKQIVSFLDVVYPRSGLIDGEKVTDFFRSHIEDVKIEDIPIPYCAIATDLATGRECAIKQGDLISAIRASISIPGIFTPARKGESFLVDGGLVNPVPVSAARNLGADYVIAVDLNHDHFDYRETELPSPADSSPGEPADQNRLHRWKLLQELNERLTEFTSPPLKQVRHWFSKDPTPNIFDVLTASINIMEAQITTVRLAEDPPEMLIQPKLGHIRFMDFHKAEETIAEGYREAIGELRSLK